MSATDLPIIAVVRAAGEHRLDVCWADGTRDLVDVGPPIRTYKAFRPLRADPALFAQAAVGEHGAYVEWGDDLEMDAVTLWRLAQFNRLGEMSAEDFRGFLEAHALTFDGAAAALGIARRNVAYYVSGEKRVPRTVALACRGYAAMARRDAA